MSTRIIDAPSAQGPVLTSAIYSLRATTDKDKIPVSIVRDPDGTCESVFATVLYSSAGSVELEDIGSLIEENFRDRGLVTDIVEVWFDSASARFTAIYCEYDMPQDFDPAASFLTSADSSVVHSVSVVSLALPGSGATESCRLVAVGPDEEGMPQVVERSFNCPRVDGHLTFPVSVVTDRASV